MTKTSLSPGARPVSEWLGFQRRQWLQAAGSWLALGGAAGAWAQQRSNVVERVGDVLVNGQPLRDGDTVRVGDELQTGPGSRVTVVVDGVALHLRSGSRLRIEAHESSPLLLGALRLITGAMGSAWSPGPARQVITPTLTAGIRGTGLYTEVFEDQGGRTYFCNCYGVIDLEAGSDRRLSQATYHQSFWAEVAPRNGSRLTETAPMNHSDAEIELLASLIQQQTAWQIHGKPAPKPDRPAASYTNLTR